MPVPSAEGPVPLQPAQIVRLLRSSTAAIETETRAAPAELRTWHPAPGEWCIHEVLGHLIEADRRGFAGRVQVLLDAENPELVAWDQRAVAAERRDCERNTEELLHELLSRREHGLQIVELLTPEDLARSGRHPKVGELSVSNVVNEWVHHDRNHLKQLLSNVQADVWPQMGAAQGFVGE